MSDAASWAAVGVSAVSPGWTTWVYYQTRQEKREAAKEARRVAACQEQAVIDGAISRVVANWAATRLKEVTYYGDPILDELKDSAVRWRLGCAEPLAVVKGTPYDLINQTVKAVSEFEEVIDPMREGSVCFRPDGRTKGPDPYAEYSLGIYQQAD